MPGRKGSMVIEVLVFLVTIVLTSAVILVLVQKGVLTVRAESQEKTRILDTEFIPFGRGGELRIVNIQFCEIVDEQFHCVGEGNTFSRGERVYVLFNVESTTYNNDVMLARNYRLLNPSGNVVMEVEERNTYHIDVQTEKEREIVVFSNFFELSNDAEFGEYLLDVIVENPLLEKKVTVRVPFMLVAE